MTGMTMKNPFAAFIKFLEGSMPNPISSFPPAPLVECQVCEGRDHITRTCPRLNTPWPKCARCGGPHRTESCGVRYPFHSDLGRVEGRYQRKQHEKGSRFGAANFMEALPSDGAAVTTVKEKITGRQPVDEFVEITEGTDVAIRRKWQHVVTPYEEPRAEPSNTKKGHLDAAEDKVSMEVVGAERKIEEVLEPHEEVAMIPLDQTPLAVEETEEQLHEAVDDKIVAELVQNGEETTTFGAQDINAMSKSDEEVEEPITAVLPPFAVEEDPVDRRTMVNHADKQQTRTANDLIEVLIEASEQGDPYSGMELPDSFVKPDDLSVVPMQVICQHPQYHVDSISNQLANVEAQTLPLPRLKYHERSWEECILSIGYENMMNIRIRHWTCINFSQCAIVGIVPQLCNELIKMCRTSRMVFEMNPVLTIQCAVQNELERTPQKCSAKKDKEKSCGSNVLETVSCAMLTDGDGYREQENHEPEEETIMKKAAAKALIICVDEGAVTKRTKACYTKQPMNPGRGRTSVSGPRMEGRCWIYFIQVANGNMWARTCRDLQIHHDQPD
ncbi:unnamed protein product [Sphagnum jensenii]|uniref:Uncharacterized protein n=1 Tax=Sphagnum jensenii TaxID=128206 RepID=A0ABP1A8X5_9BRYO